MYFRMVQVKKKGEPVQVARKINIFFLTPLFPLLCLPFSHLLNEMFPQFHSTQDGSGRAWQLREQMTYNQRTAWKANTRFTERLAIQSLSAALSNLQLRTTGQFLKWNAFCFSRWPCWLLSSLTSSPIFFCFFHVCCSADPSSEGKRSNTAAVHFFVISFPALAPVDTVTKHFTVILKAFQKYCDSLKLTQ